MAASFSADIASGKAKAERLNQEIQELQVIVNLSAGYFYVPYMVV
jgi:hypothetical protein